ncbi:MAG: hypothetical protein ACOX1Y_03210 [Zhaonellaceae bacterium]|jgi:hypothetical protein|nr:hypothetical protein [Clostridia bacterium]
MAGEFERMIKGEEGEERKERGYAQQAEEPKAKLEPMRVSSSNTESLGFGGKDKCKDKCKKKKPHHGLDKQLIFIIFLILILLLLSD